MKKILLVSANYPDYYHVWGPWNKCANIAISKVNNIETEIVAPRPYSLPFKFFPHSEMYNIPIKEQGEEGIIHHPRFLYLLPKKIFYGPTGDFYKLSVSKYVFQNIKKTDLIHSHHAYPDGYGIIPVCKKWHIPLVVDIHGDTLFSSWLNHNILSRKVMKTLDFSSKIICISKNIYSLAVENGLNEEKLEYIPLGVDIGKFKPRNKEKIRREFNIHEQKIVLFVGELIKRKGINYLLKAISRINQSSIKDTKVIIIGDGIEKTNLLNLSRELNLQDLVIFRGKVPEDELLKWYSLADIFVLFSLSEGRPTVINEAMASGCAIVATNVSGIPEQVENGHNGFLVEAKNAEVLSEKISYLLNNKEEMVRMGQNGRKRIIEEDLTWEGYAKRVKNIYKELV
jgi:glycosyltransferase involved in cell wall biosynthesis